jgi:HEAT repeat protein
MGVRAQAASALGEIGSKAAVEPLITLLETQNNKNVGEPRSTSSERDTEAAIWALRKITGNDFASDAQKWRAWLEGGK